MPDQPNAPEMSAEQLADLQRLELAANEPDQEVAKLAEAEHEQHQLAEQSLAEKNAAALSMAFELAVPTLAQFGFPTVAGVLGAQCEKVPGMTNGQVLATVWAPVLAKYGVNLDSFGDKYKLEITAVLVTAPIAKAVYIAVRVDTGKGRASSAHGQVFDPAEAAPAQASPAEPVVLGAAQGA